MQGLKLLVVVVVALAFVPSRAEAQGKKVKEPALIDMCTFFAEVSPTCQKEVADWIKADEKWRKHMSQWGNITVYWISDQYRAVTPRIRPQPPLWLAVRCQAFVKDLSDEMCFEYRKYQRYDWLMHVTGPEPKAIYNSVVVKLTGLEDSSFKEFFLKNFHFDGFWTNSSNGPRSYGTFGFHLTIAQINRVYIWAGPGVILIKQPVGPFKVMTTIGVDLRLKEVRIPFLGPDKKVIYLTFGKAVMPNQMIKIINNKNAGENMMGISITWKR